MLVCHVSDLVSCTENCLLFSVLCWFNFVLGISCFENVQLFTAEHSYN